VKLAVFVDHSDPLGGVLSWITDLAAELSVMLVGVVTEAAVRSKHLFGTVSQNSVSPANRDRQLWRADAYAIVCDTAAACPAL
jgi:hypothetical protein